LCRIGGESSLLENWLTLEVGSGHASNRLSNRQVIYGTFVIRRKRTAHSSPKGQAQGASRMTWCRGKERGGAACCSAKLEIVCAALLINSNDRHPEEYGAFPCDEGSRRIGYIIKPNNPPYGDKR